ncbi:MAG: hypothetical protein CM1200mP30_12020 [Pseudomonadota bacterium]|nr:MAG: hypothetical protein CM1200mP30_12020 [Pseudomonadota bacterium]
MANSPEPRVEETAWTVAVARILFGHKMNIQTPPNLNPGSLKTLLDSGINDWGGISPLTPDHVNPEAPWPEIASLAESMEKYGKVLTERLPVFPKYALNSRDWIDLKASSYLIKPMDQQGMQEKIVGLQVNLLCSLLNFIKVRSKEIQKRKPCQICFT